MKTLDNLTYTDKPAADFYQRRVYLLCICVCYRTVLRVASATHLQEERRKTSDGFPKSILPLRFSIQRLPSAQHRQV